MPPAVPSAPDILLALLECPEDVGTPSARLEQETRWQKITHPHDLFLALKNCVDMFQRADTSTQDWVRETLQSATAEIAKWQQFASYPGSKERLRQWEIASALVHAALSAVLTPQPSSAPGAKSEEKGLHDADLALRKGDWPSVTAEWQEVARLSFTLAQVKPRTLMIPFVYVGDKAGDIGYLKFDLVDSETPRLAHHPMHAFCSTIKEEFETSLRRAWTWSGGTWYGRWRLVKPGARRGEGCLASAMGESAGGAAAYGLGCLAHGHRWDSGVMVLARIDEDFRLDAVHGIAEKIEAIIAKTPATHTIVVVEQNRRDAVGELTRLRVRFNLEMPDGKRYRSEPNALCCIRLHRGWWKRLTSWTSSRSARS